MHQTPKGCTWRVPVHVSGDSGEGGVSGEILYHLNRLGPSCSLGFEFIGDQMIVVRNFVLIMTLQLGDGKWFVTAPGNGFAGDTPLETISSAVGISPIGGLRGSSGLVHLEPEDLADSAVSLWFDNDVEIPEIDVLGASESSVTSSLITNFAADLAHTTANELQLCSIDVDVPRWSRFPALFDGWLRSRGHTSPGDAPDWVASAMIYEAQIGFSVFAQTNHYSPYPEVTDLTSDLDRICGLGFTVIQLMPRQPYPSYNIHDFWNVDVSYGPRVMLVELIEQCHARGMRIIFDVLLHGVLDQDERSPQASQTTVEGTLGEHSREQMPQMFAHIPHDTALAFPWDAAAPLYRQTQAEHLGVAHLCLWTTTGRHAGLDVALVKIVHNDVQCGQEGIYV